MVEKLESAESGENMSKREEDIKSHKKMLTDIINTSKMMENNIDNLIEKINTGPDTSQGISFLDLKNDLLIDYNMNLLYVMMKKTSEGVIDGDAAVERLCSLRTIMEKIRPIEHKLKYQIDKCVSVAETGHIDKNDPARFKANPDQLTSKLADDDDDDDSEDDDEEEVDNKESKKYVAPKNVPTYFVGDKSKEEMESEMMAKKKKSALSHTMMRELKQQLYDAPEEVSHEADVKKAKHIAEEREKELYEEDNFIRLPISKSERQAKRNVFTVSNVGSSLTSFGINDFDGSGGGQKRKRSSGGGKGKSKKKFKIKKKK